MTTYRTHAEMIQLFKDLCDAHPDQTSYWSAGKTYLNNDMWVFRIGNPDGGKVLWDGCMHGWEDMGEECMYLVFEWLLTSGETKASQILSECCHYIMPVVNYDSEDWRGNQNTVECPSAGVDLNRNFVHGWQHYACGYGPYGTSTGSTYASEDETQVVRSVFTSINPEVYINTHYGGGPFFGYRGTNTATFWTPLRTRILELYTEYSIYPQNVGINDYLPPTPGSLGDGEAIGDAYDAGIEPFLWEVMNRNDYADSAPCDYDVPGGGNPPYSVVTSCAWLFAKAHFVAISEAVGIPQPSQDWYDTSWAYKKLATVTNPYIDHPMQITLGWATGGDVNLGGHSKPDFGDVRFVDSTNTVLLPYWMETKTDSSSSIFWVRSSGASELNIYYGNGSATYDGDGDAVFTFFDAFDGSTLNGDKWKVTQGVAPVLSGGCALITYHATRNAIEQQTINHPLFTRPAIVHTRGSLAGEQVASFSHVCGFRGPGSSTHSAFQQLTDPTTIAAQNRKDAGGYDITSAIQGPYNVWQRREVRWYPTAVQYYLNDTLFATHTNTARIPDTSLTAYLYDPSSGNGVWNIDHVFVYPTSTVLPTWNTFSGEVSYTGPTGASDPSLLVWSVNTVPLTNAHVTASKTSLPRATYNIPTYGKGALLHSLGQDARPITLNISMWGDDRFALESSLRAELEASPTVLLIAEDEHYVYDTKKMCWLIPTKFSVKDADNQLQCVLEGFVDENTLHSCDILAYWSASSITADTDTSFGAKSVVSWQTYDVMVCNFSAQPVDLSEKKYLGICYKLSNGSYPTLQVEIHSAAGYYLWVFTDKTVEDWLFERFDLESPDSTVGLVDMTQITSIQIAYTKA